MIMDDYEREKDCLGYWNYCIFAVFRLLFKHMYN